MADVIPFPVERTTPPWTKAYEAAREQLEDIAEQLDVPGLCGRADLLRLQCRILVEHYGVQHTLDLLETAQLYVGARGNPTTPGSAA